MHILTTLYRGVHSQHEGKKNAADSLLQNDSHISESIDDIVSRARRENCDGQELFDVLMMKNSSLSCVDKLTAGVQALCRLGRSDLAAVLYNAEGIIFHYAFHFLFTPV